jgi:hypothetical protein
VIAPQVGAAFPGGLAAADAGRIATARAEQIPTVIEVLITGFPRLDKNINLILVIPPPSSAENDNAIGLRRPAALLGQFLCGCFAAVVVLFLKTAPAVGAGLALVLAIDVSASVTADSYLLQRNGIASAFENPRLVEALSAVPGGIEVLVLEWSDPDQTKVTVGWQRVGDFDSAAGFAAAVHSTKRTSNGLTAIGPALLAGAAAFDGLPEPADHRIIDISGDGMANFGLPPTAARDRIVGAGITINGLAILTEEPWLESYYRSNVIGGRGAFVVAARDFSSFADAILRKLVQEVAGILPATAGSAAEQLRCNRSGSAGSR